MVHMVHGSLKNKIFQIVVTMTEETKTEETFHIEISRFGSKPKDKLLKKEKEETEKDNTMKISIERKYKKNKKILLKFQKY